jgi:hypothetical protein
LVTVSVALEGSQQLVHFGLGQVLPDPVDIVPPAVLFERLVALRYFLACRSHAILPDISAVPLTD